ncbi:MAG: hypothetical protein ACE5NM_13865, partial [Sedimentisphaerales bacterium]
MIRLSDSAQKRLDKYLQQMRTCLHGCKTVDADEVQRDIIEHIERELEGAAEPVAINRLDEVLDRLGSPSQWVPPEEATWWRKATLRLRTDSENWPLAYVAFGLFLLFLFSNLIPIRWGLLWPVWFWPFILWQRFGWVILLLASFCLARALISRADDPKVLGAQRWLIYPPLIFVYIPIFLIILLWPVLTTAGWHGYGNWMLKERTLGFYRWLDYRPYQIAYLPGIWWFRTVLGLALWWIVLAGMLLIWPGLMRVVFRPFADWFNRKWAGLLLVIAILLVILYAGTGLFMMSGRYYFNRPF